MRAERQKPPDLAWTRAPWTELIRLSWPIAVSMVSYSVMTLVDTLFVGRLGAAALAGVGLSGVTAFTLLCFPMGLLGGVRILVSQAVGAGRRSETKDALTAGLVLALICGLAFAGLGEAVAVLLPLVADTAESGEAARVYLSIRALGAPGFLIFTALREHRLGLGDSRWPMWAAVAANLCNIALDWLLIVALGQGVAGAAWATVFSTASQALFLWLAPGRVKVALGGRWRHHLRSIWRLGAPNGLQFLLEVGSFTALSWMIAAYGELHMAAHQIALQVIHFTFLPGVAVSDGASVLAGQAVGADRDDLVSRVSRVSLATAGGYALLCTLVLSVGAPWIVAPFTSDRVLRDLATSLLYVAAVFQVFDAANVVARGVLKGTGDVRWTAAVGIFTAWLMTPPLTWLLGFACDLGAFGGWIALCGEIILGAALFWRRIITGGWHPAAARSRAELAREELLPGRSLSGERGLPQSSSTKDFKELSLTPR